MGKIRTGIFLIYLLASCPVLGQDAVFSQFFNTTLYLNPALAGIEDEIIVNSNYRTQWNSLQFPYQTTQISAVMPYYRDKHQKPFGHLGGLGLSIYNDVAGRDNNFKTTGLNSNFAYNLPLDRHYIHVITFGLQTGLVQKRIDTSTLQWGEQYNPYVGFDSSISPTEAGEFRNRAFFDVGSGIFWFYNPLAQENRVVTSINSGISVAHMNHPDESMVDFETNRLPLLYKYHGGIVFRISTHVTASANVLVAYQNETSQQNFGTYFSYTFHSESDGLITEGVFRLGGWYRAQDAAIFLTEFETPKFKLAFSYDMNTSSLRYGSRGIGSYEVHLGLRFAEHELPKSRY
ncbi:MAG: PorP/SprF family type IX secretion system membrane protein [Cyclobacteriaceae bacterium]|nr:PorP/SprF family type IX secretion system membrane protein [Cyclobacteriaceae bacterium]